MLKILVRLYLILLVTYGAASYLVPEALLQVFYERYSRYTLEQLHGPLSLVQRTFKQAPPARWPALQQELAAELAPISLRLVPLEDPALSSEERAGLAAGQRRVRLGDYGEPSAALVPLPAD